jgi:predicted ATP-grasp superfamily ATP-dependent carboligase
VIVFIYEYTCAVGARVAPSLAVEGRAMLTAICEDFARVPGVEIRTLPNDDEDAFRTLARTADASLLIAPEFGDLLATRCRWVLEARGRLLGPSPEAVCLTADKLALARHLRGHGVPTPLTRLATGELADLAYPLVCKPRHGAGSLATVLVRSPQELEQCAAHLQKELTGDEAIVQPFAPGTPASVAFLLGPRQVIPLLPGVQQLSDDGHFRFGGGCIPLPPALAARAVGLGLRAVEAVHGLRGYIGVDLVLGSSADGSGDQVIEINPRLTTSYLGLRALAETNLALAMLQVFEGDVTQAPAWRSGTVGFTPDGTITLHPVSARA